MFSQVASWRSPRCHFGADRAPTLSAVFSHLLKNLFLCGLEKDEETSHHKTYLIQPLTMTSMHELFVLILDKVFMLCSLIFCCSLFPKLLSPRLFDYSITDGIIFQFHTVFLYQFVQLIII